MSTRVFGRTNREFPPIFLALSNPPDPDAAEDLVERALATGLPLDVSRMPAYWGGLLRARGEVLLASGGRDLENATDERHAADLISAHLLQTLSALSREHITFFFLRVRRALEEFQINGALEALEAARQDGHIAFLGLQAEGNPMAVRSVWQFHDAFEALMVPRSHLDSDAYDALSPLAKERRVGVLTTGALDWLSEPPAEWRYANLTRSFYGQSLRQAVLGDLAREATVLAPVSTAAEVDEAAAVPNLAVPEGVATLAREIAGG